MKKQLSAVPNDLAQQPICTLIDNSLAIFRQAGEEFYDICVIKGTDENNEEMVGSCRIEAIMTGKVEVKDIFSKMAWVKNPENGTYRVRVFAVNAEGMQSKPASFPPAEYTFTAPEAPVKTDVTGTDASKDAGTTGAKNNDANDASVKKDEGKGADKPAAGLSPEDVVALNKVPARLNKIARDLNALPRDNEAAWSMLTSMSNALNEDIVPFLVKVAIFGDKASTNAESLLTEAKALNGKIENTRAFRSDNWNLKLKPRLHRIKGIIDQLGYQVGEVGEAAFKELATMMAIVKRENPGMTMEDLTALNSSSAQLLRDVEALLVEKEAAEKQKKDGEKGADKNKGASKVASQRDLEYIHGLLDQADQALEKQDTAQITAITQFVEKAERKLGSIKMNCPDTDPETIKTIEVRLTSAKTVLAELVAKSKDEAKKKDEEKDKKDKKDEKKDPWYKRAPKAVWNWICNLGGRIGSKWPLLLLLLIPLLLWWFYDRDNKGTNVVPPVHSSAPTGNTESATPPAPTPVPAQATNEVAKAIEKALPALTNALPGTTLNLNSAQSISVSNSFKLKGGIKGHNNSIITGNGQVNVVITYNTSTNNYIYNGLGSSTPVKANEPAAIQLPASLSSDKKCSDGSYRWPITLAQGQTYSRGTRPGWALQVNSDAASPLDLKTEIKGLDKQWHTMLPDSTNTVAGTEYRFSVRPEATRAVELYFWLFPTK